MKPLYGIVMAAVPLLFACGAFAAEGVCTTSTQGMFQACKAEVKDDGAEGKVICNNIADQEEAYGCLTEVVEESQEASKLCKEQAKARAEVCDAIGEDAYDMSEFWVAENFIDLSDPFEPASPNPWFNLSVGTTNAFYGEGETITVVVTAETKLIEGVSCRTVNDLVTEDGLDVEDTDDWYAQDIYGNVWYCGEVSLNYEFYEGDDPEEAELVDIEGSWKAFRDGAQPGILLHYDPQVGSTYRQEMAWGDAEDMATVVTVSADGLLEGDDCGDEDITEAVAEHLAGMCVAEDCLVTLEFTALEPEVAEHKYYAPGVGLLLELEDGECIATQGVIDEVEDDEEDKEDEDD